MNSKSCQRLNVLVKFVVDYLASNVVPKLRKLVAVKRIAIIFVVTILFPVLGFNEGPRPEDGVKKIVIDAGHGGKDPGNLGTGRYKTREKDIALDVSLMVGKYIKEYLPDVEVIYTRQSDEYPELWQRTQLANKEKANLFISIHCDAFTKSSAKGCQSIVMGYGHTDKNMRVAKKENAVIFLEDDYETKYQGFDPNKPETLIGLTLGQEIYLDRSISLAGKIQDQFRERVNRVDRGVKQQPLWVTSQVTMPSVLVELGFLTNPAEEDFLNTQKGKEYMASAIFRAFRDYKQEIEMDLGVLKPNEKLPEGPEKQEIPEHFHDDEEGIDPDLAENSSVEMEKKESPEADEVWLGIQIMSTTEEVDLNDPKFEKLAADIRIIEVKDSKKVIYGKTTKPDDLEALKGQARYAGFTDCFPVGIQGNKRINLAEAKRLLK